mgnify:CR=1 FL=1
MKKFKFQKLFKKQTITNENETQNKLQFKQFKNNKFNSMKVIDLNAILKTYTNY